MRNIFLALMLTIVGGVASAKDIKTVIFTTMPQMHCSNCEQKIKKNIRFERGVKDIKTNVDTQKVTITYDANKTSVDKLQAAFAKIHYTTRVTNEKEQIKTEEGGTCENM